MGKYFYYGEGRYTPSAILKEKTITENGTYEPLQDGADGYDSVTVNVSGGGSSDFSTAEVTVLYEGGNLHDVSGHFDVELGSADVTQGSAWISNDFPKIIKLPYVDSPINMYFIGSQADDAVTCIISSYSGNVTVSEDSIYASITGDCTITLASEGLPQD